MAAFIFTVVVLEQSKQPQVLAVEPSARVNQISLKELLLYLKDTAVTFYVMLTEKTLLPVLEPYMCTILAPPQQSEE